MVLWLGVVLRVLRAEFMGSRDAAAGHDGYTLFVNPKKDMYDQEHSCL